MGAEIKIISLSVEEPTLCVIGLALKQGQLRQAHRIYVRFYDPKYLPLPTPHIKKTDDGYEVCAPEDYKFYTVNGEDKKRSWFTGKCFEVKELKEILVWDQLGRFSWLRPSLDESHKTSLYLNQLNHNPYQYQRSNNWTFYGHLYDFGYEKVMEVCESVHEKVFESCVHEQIASLKDHPEFVRMVERWDQ